MPRRSLPLQTAIYAAVVSIAVCLVVSLLLFRSHQQSESARLIERATENLTQLWTYREQTPESVDSWERWQSLMNQTPDVLYTYLVDKAGKIELGIEGRLSPDIDETKQAWEPAPGPGTKEFPGVAHFSATRFAEELLAGRVKSGDPLALLSLAVDCGAAGCRQLRAVVRLQSVSKASLALRRSLLLAALAICLGTGLLVFFVTKHQMRAARPLAIVDTDRKIKQAVTDFSAQVAHDLRSPLAALELGAERLDGLPPERQSLVRSAVGRLREIIQALVPGQAMPVARAFTRIEIPASREVVVVDDDACVHDLWKERFGTRARLQHFTSLAAFKAAFSGGDKLYLIDHEFVGESSTGLSAILELGLQREAVLVTSRFDEPSVRERCQAARVRLLPKTDVAKIELAFPAEDSPHAVLVDDDPLVCAGWHLSAKKRGKRLLAFRSGDELRRGLGEIPRTVPVFIDSNLGDTERGEKIAEELHKGGFSSVYLVTGYSPSQFEPMPWLKGILDKTPPDWLF